MRQINSTLLINPVLRYLIEHHAPVHEELVTDLSALCLHLSTRLAILRSPSVLEGKLQPTELNALKTHRLTPREIQIAELVAQGRTNAQVGAALWITENSVKQALKRMFRKLDVSARAEMVAKLQDILN